MNILGIGEMVIDIISENNEFIKYQGGGTSYNVIYNLIGSKNKLFLGGLCGNDNLALDEIKALNEKGIDTELIEIKNKKTRIVNTNIITDINGYKDTENNINCPNCGKDTWKSSSSYKIEIEAILSKEIDIVIFDSYKKDNISIAQECKNKGIKTVLDWGTLGNLRYLDSSKIQLISKNPFDIIQINGRVAKFLKSRLQVESDNELAEFLNTELLIVTYNKNGANIIFNGVSKIHFNVPKIIDKNGAGDAFLSAVIKSYVDNIEHEKELISTLQINAQEITTSVLSTKGSRLGSSNLLIENTEDECDICGRNKTIIQNRKRKYKLTSALEKIQERIDNSLNSNMNKDVINLLNNLKNNILLVGQGASFITATYISDLINDYSNNISIALTTNEVYEFNVDKYNEVLLFSTSGNSPDSNNLITYLQAKGIKINLITAKESVNFDNINIISYYNKAWTRERGFISIESIVIPALYFTDYFNVDKEDIFKLSKQILNSDITYDINLNKCINNIDIFYSYNSKVIALDLESKLIESGASRVNIHEKKNFSHGRFSILKTNPSNQIIYIDNGNTKYDKVLIDYLKKKELKIIELNPKSKNTLLKKYELLLLNQLFIEQISRKMERDLSDPGYDKEDKKLYKFKK